MCCGAINKPNKQRLPAPTVEVQEPSNNVVPVQINVKNDNINSQRAAAVTRENYHRLRYGRG